MISVMIDGTPLLLRSAGVKNHLYYWIRGLTEFARGNRVSVFPFLNGFGRVAHETSVVGRVATWERLALLIAANISPYPILNWLVPRADIFHVSQQMLNPPRKAPLTATIYDMTCWLVPEMHTTANVIGTKRMAERVYPLAAGLIAISECTKADAVRVMGIKPELIDVIPPGVAPAFFEVPAAAAQETPLGYGLRKPYVLYVGTIEPRKNLNALLDAWQQLSSSLREQFELVIAGSWGWGDRAVFDRLQSGIPGVRYLGYVPEPDLPAVTAAATIFAYVSLYEGFGLPVGQAMAAGVPVLTSNVSSLPEVVGDAGVTADPRSREEIRGALERLLLTPSLRSQLSELGRRRARQFTSAECARKSWNFFERVAS